MKAFRTLLLLFGISFFGVALAADGPVKVVYHLAEGLPQLPDELEIR